MHGDMIGLDRTTLSELFRQARESPRLRSHLLLHADHSDQVQRLVIALQAGTYVRAHLHSQQWEMLVLLQGRADVLFFAPTGRLDRRIALAGDRLTLIQIPPQQIHGAVVLQDDTAVIEIKPGPYRANEFVDWAPPEGTADAQAFVDWASAAEPGAVWTSRTGS
jgi:cupin fold WbuC family metalloprotein